MIDPVTRWIISACAVLALLCVVGLVSCHKGAKGVQNEWDASIARGKVEVERLKGEAGKVTVRTETQYVEVVKKVRVKGETVVREVPVFVPAGSPELGPGWRVYHDAASKGAIPDPARIPDAAPVDPETAAATVAGNYFTCHETAARLTALQGWVTEQHRLNPGE